MFIYKCLGQAGVVHNSSPSTQEVEADQPGLHSEFQATQGCIVKSCLNNKNIPYSKNPTTS